MGGKKPKKQKQPKVVERDLKAEQEQAAAIATQKANEEAAYKRRAKGRMMIMRSGASQPKMNSGL